MPVFFLGWFKDKAFRILSVNAWKSTSYKLRKTVAAAWQAHYDNTNMYVDHTMAEPDLAY